MRVFFSAGEASGDAYAAALLREMATLGNEWSFEGIGGPRLAAEDARIWADSSRWGAISILQSLRVAPKVVGGYSRGKYALRKGIPGLFIPIDFGYMNVKLARYAKSKGWKVLYFIPPGSWRRDKQGRDLPQVADEIVTPFPWSAEILGKMGASVHFFGHPLKQLIRDGRPNEGGMEAYSSSPPQVHGPTLAILPGSRMHEIKENLSVIAGALSPGPAPSPRTPHRGERLEPSNTSVPSHLSNLSVEFAVASSINLDELKRRWRKLAPRRESDLFTQGDTYGVLRRARAAIVCSGTATLETVLCRCPMVVMYRFGKMTEMELRLRRVKPRFIALPNVLFDREVVTELVQARATPKRIRAALDELIGDGPARREQMTAFEELDAILGPDDAITKTAQLALALMQR